MTLISLSQKRRVENRGLEDLGEKQFTDVLKERLLL